MSEDYRDGSERRRSIDSKIQAWIPLIVSLSGMLVGGGVLWSELQSQVKSQITTNQEQTKVLQKVADRLDAMERGSMLAQFERRSLAEKITEQRIATQLVRDITSDLGTIKAENVRILTNVQRLWNLARVNQANVATIASKTNIEVQIPDP